MTAPRNTRMAAVAAAVSAALLIGMTGTALGLKTFGASAPLKELQTKFGFTTERVVEAAKDQLRRSQR